MRSSGLASEKLLFRPFFERFMVLARDAASGEISHKNTVYLLLLKNSLRIMC